uniref:CSON003060 protein n=1 Tax=Culicoides sonorensis TaxID=179676 RepID=A0A336MYI0_CULSO
MMEIESTPIMGNKSITEEKKTDDSEFEESDQNKPENKTDELKEIKEDILNPCISKCDEVQESDINDTNALLKQLDEALDEKVDEEPLVKDQSAEEKQLDTIKDTDCDAQEPPKPNDDDHPEELLDDIDEGDLQIISELDECKENEILSEETEEQTKDKNESPASNPECVISDNESSKLPDDAPKSPSDTLENKSKNDTLVQEKPQEDLKGDLILLESDEEESSEKTSTSNMETTESTLKRPIVESTNDDSKEVEPPSKKTRSDDDQSETETLIPETKSSQKGEESEDIILIENDGGPKENLEDNELPSQDLLLITGHNRRRSDDDSSSIKNEDQAQKRPSDSITEDEGTSESSKRSKLIDDKTDDDVKDTNEQDDDDMVNEEVKCDSPKESLKCDPSTEDIKPNTKPLDVQTVELDPKPEDNSIQEKHQDTLPVEFLKKFKKSFQLMNRSDLEEFVLQKIVETIINKSELSEVRQKNEIQEQTISNQRQRIADLSKQFRDLEMVHNRVVKDLETKSSGLVTPVKITRAVGLQVSQPRAKNEMYRQTYAQQPPNQRVPPFPSRSPQRPINISNNAVQTAQRMNMSLRQNIPQMQQSTTQTIKTSPIRQIGQMSQNTPAKMIALQKQQSLQRHQQIIQQNRIQNTIVARQNMTPQNTRTSLNLSSPGRVINQSLNTSNPSPNSSVLMRKVIRPGPASVQQAALQQDKTVQKPFIDLTDEEEMNSRTLSHNGVKIHVKTPAALNSSVPPQLANGANRNLQTTNINKTSIQRLPVQIQPKTTQPNSQAQIIRRQIVAGVNQKRVHPAPLPLVVNKVNNAAWKRPPPRPQIRINNIDAGIVISWTIHEPHLTEDFAEIVKYQIYAYQETNQPPATEAWRHVGDVKAMALPMAVTLTQFQEGQRYHFAVRAVDVHERAGTFSVPRTWDEKI